MRIKVKPAPGVLVRDPADNSPLSAAGEWVEDGTYWRRRIADRDVTLLRGK